MEYLISAIAGLTVLGLVIHYFGRQPNTPADYEKGWRDFYR